MALTRSRDPAKIAERHDNRVRSWLRGFNATDIMLSTWYLALTSALVIWPHSLAHYTGYFILHLLVLGLIAGLVSLSPLGRWWRLAHDWYPSLVFIAAFEETARLALAFVPRWQDAFILRAEATLFPVPPTLWLGHIRSIWISEPLEFGYFTFYWMMVVVGAVLYEGVWKAASLGEANHPRQPFRIWMDATVLGYILCYATYLLFPTEGPARTLPRPLTSALTGPFHWIVQLIQHHAGVHGNAFPSGHIMASVVALLAAAKWKPRLARWLPLPVLLMCIGAVYDGYHYASDIIAGALLGGVVFWLILSIHPLHPAD
jgi:membrane-associated phospholipid phosphatase